MKILEELEERKTFPKWFELLKILKILMVIGK
jgi:hypothetical protein